MKNYFFSSPRPNINNTELSSFSGETFPCTGRLVALRGYDGKELWTIRIASDPFEINCHNIDIDKDGKPDCIACGRRGLAVAFDPRKGKVELCFTGVQIDKVSCSAILMCTVYLPPPLSLSPFLFLSLSLSHSLSRSISLPLSHSLFLYLVQGER